MYKIILNLFIFMSLTVLFLTNESKSSEKQARKPISKNELQQLIDNGTIFGRGNDAKAIFTELFSYAVDNNVDKEPLLGGYRIVAWDHKKTEEDYRNVLKEIYGEDNADFTNEKTAFQAMLADSICSFYEISTRDLRNIMQNKHMISKKKKEISELFITNLKILEDKFNRDKMIEVITEKVLQKQNESSIPTVPDTVPDCPPLI